MSSNLVYIDGKRYKWVDQFAKSDEWKAILAWADYEGAPPPTNDVPFDQLIKDLKSAGIWQKLDVFYVFAGDGSPLFKELNWIDPSKHMASAYGGLTWDLNGVKGDGVNGYINTNFNPSEDGVNYTMDDACMFLGIPEDYIDPPTYSRYIAIKTGPRDHSTYLNVKFSQNGSRNDLSMAINAPSAKYEPTSVINVGGAGIKYIGRSSSNDIIIVSKEDVYERKQSSGLLTNGNIDIHRSDLNNYVPNIIVNCFGMGAYLTYSETQILRVAFNKFLASLGLTPTV